jgi:hypothetical protein
MIIREDQVAAFQQSARSQFELEMLAHMKEFAPELCRLRGDRVILTVIRSGISRAEGAGFTLRGSIRLFLELLFNFGHGFDSDPQLTWAQDLLIDRSTNDEQSRATRLYIRARNYLNEVAGPDNVYASEALARQDSLRSFAAIPDGRPVENRILDAMRFMHPQKFRAVGEPTLRQIIAKAAQVSAAHRLPAEKGTALLSGLMYGFGHEIATDPLYPWVSGTLEDPLTTDREGAVTRLYEKTKIYVAAMANRRAQRNVKELT